MSYLEALNGLRWKGKDLERSQGDLTGCVLKMLNLGHQTEFLLVGGRKA